ncbi:hypothetical protein ORF19A [Aviadenovirus bubonis]|nr:hypothetical protein ORF19A [Owl adenovirus]
MFLAIDTAGLYFKKIEFILKHRVLYPNVALVDVSWNCTEHIADFVAHFNVSWLFSRWNESKISCLGYKDGAHICASLCKSAYYQNVTCRRIVALEPSWFYREINCNEVDGGLHLKSESNEFRYYVSKLDAKYVVVITGHFKRHGYVQYKIGHELIIMRKWQSMNVIDCLLSFLERSLTLLRWQPNKPVHVSSWHLGVMSRVFSSMSIWNDNETAVYETIYGHNLQIVLTKDGVLYGDYFKMLELKLPSNCYYLYFIFVNEYYLSKTLYVYNWPHSSLIAHRLYLSTLNNSLSNTLYTCRKTSCRVHYCYKYDCKKSTLLYLQDYRRILDGHVGLPGKTCLPSMGLDFMLNFSEEGIVTERFNFSSLLRDVQLAYNIQTMQLDNVTVANNWRRCNITELDGVIVSHPSYQNMSFKMRFRTHRRHCLMLYSQFVRYDYCFSANATGLFYLN